jgi:hypothetical protein
VQASLPIARFESVRRLHEGRVFDLWKFHTGGNDNLHGSTCENWSTIRKSGA